MKKTAILLFYISCAASMAQAQLSMPDPATSVGTADSIGAPAASAPAVQSKYYTPSTSYKAERNNIREGNSLFKNEKYYEALEAYDRALLENGSSIRARYNKAVTLLQLQNDDNKGTSADPRAQAASVFTDLLSDALQYDRDIAEQTYYNLGNMAFNDEQYDQSIECYKSALRINPDDWNARENLRLAQLKKEQQEQNQDKQDQDKEDKEEQQQQQQEQQQNQDQQQEQQQQPQEQKPMTNSAQQILQTMQNKENATRKKVQAQEEPATGRPMPEKPW